MRRFFPFVVPCVFVILAVVGAVGGCAGKNVPPTTIAVGADHISRIIADLEKVGGIGPASGRIWVVGVGTSRDLQTAIDIAEHDAQVKLARYIAPIQQGREDPTILAIVLRMMRREAVRPEVVGPKYRVVVLFSMGDTEFK